MKNKIELIIFLFFTLLTVRCNSLNNRKNHQEPLARVYDRYLYRDDIEGLFDENTSQEDSLIIAQTFINKWIKNQLILRKAEENLSPYQKDVEIQLEDYRTSLLIYKYEQQWIEENLDTFVTKNEIAEYYDNYFSNFVLDEIIVKALFLKVPRISPNIELVKRWYKSDEEEDLRQLESYSYEYAQTFDTFNEDWFVLNNILSEAPFNPDITSKVETRRYFETSDSLFYYFLNIRDYKPIGEIAPLSFVEENINQIILNKRKLQLVEELERSIYNDALNYGYFKVYE
ncbi:hypothetical protein ACFLSA_01180 [Bacteroidota bacterium]